jgi:quercetin dioxygenase-like cupin family protein
MTELKAMHVDFNSMPAERMRGTITRRFANTDSTMLAEVRMVAGDIVPAHRHHNEQFTYVISGLMKFFLGEEGEEIQLVGPGQLLAIPGGLLHKVEILEDTFEIDVFNPPRQDWIDGTDAYLQR